MPSTPRTSSPRASRSSSASACSALVDSPRAPPDVEPTLRHSSPADEESQCFIRCPFACNMICCLSPQSQCFIHSMFAPSVLFVSLATLSLSTIHHHPYPFIHTVVHCHLFSGKHNTGDIKLAFCLLRGCFQRRTFANPEPLHPQLQKSSVRGLL